MERMTPPNTFPRRFAWCGIITSASSRRENETGLASMSAPSARVQELDHVSVVHDVVLALVAHLVRVARALLAAVRDVVGPADDLRAREALRDVRVDLARRLER